MASTLARRSITTSVWPRLHALAVAHQHLLDDAAFLVLDHLAVHVDLDEARRDHRAGKRRGPTSQAAHHQPMPSSITSDAGRARCRVELGALGGAGSASAVMPRPAPAARRA